MVTLRNTQNRRQVFELPHDFVCSEDECLCSLVEQKGRTHNPETGEAGVRSDEVRVPGAVHISARGVTQALPDGVLNIPAVADAIRRGLLIAD